MGSGGGRGLSLVPVLPDRAGAGKEGIGPGMWGGGTRGGRWSSWTSQSPLWGGTVRSYSRAGPCSSSLGPSLQMRKLTLSERLTQGHTSNLNSKQNENLEPWTTRLVFLTHLKREEHCSKELQFKEGKTACPKSDPLQVWVIYNKWWRPDNPS